MPRPQPCQPPPGCVGTAPRAPSALVQPPPSRWLWAAAARAAPGEVPLAPPACQQPRHRKYLALLTGKWASEPGALRSGCQGSRAAGRVPSLVLGLPVWPRIQSVAQGRRRDLWHLPPPLHKVGREGGGFRCPSARWLSSLLHFLQPCLRKEGKQAADSQKKKKKPRSARGCRLHR